MAANALMSCGVAAICPSVLSSSKSKFSAAVPLPNGGAIATYRLTMNADWMPGQPRPPYLDGSAPGFGSWGRNCPEFLSFILFFGIMWMLGFSNGNDVDAWISLRKPD